MSLPLRARVISASSPPFTRWAEGRVRAEPSMPACMGRSGAGVEPVPGPRGDGDGDEAMKRRIPAATPGRDASVTDVTDER